MVAINNRQRDDIADAVVRHGFNSRFIELIQLENALMDKLYERLYNAKIRAKINSLVEDFKGAFPFERRISVNAAGQNISVRARSSYSEPLLPLSAGDVSVNSYPFPYSGDRTVSIQVDDPMCDEVRAYAALKQELSAEAESKRAMVMGILQQCRSVEQLQQKWPDVMPIAKPFLKVAPAKPQLPMTIIEDLNKTLDLPPEQLAA